jgi:protein gp37
MSEHTSIAWCDHTFNPWWGCSKVSEGCKNCYAEKIALRLDPGSWGPDGERKGQTEVYWAQLETWNKKALAKGRRARVFCGSMCDIMEAHNELPIQRIALWYEVFERRNLDFLLLTKRPENFLNSQYFPINWIEDGCPPNVWAMTSVENQERAEERIPHLQKVKAIVRGLSCEPLLGPLDLTKLLHCGHCRGTRVEPRGHAPCSACGGTGGKIHWVIIGGESGPGSRECYLEWIVDIVQQCQDQGVCVFVKQLGSKPMCKSLSKHPMRIIAPRGKNDDPREWPPFIRYQEFPPALPLDLVEKFPGDKTPDLPLIVPNLGE